jgi:hypothetical protein
MSIHTVAVTVGRAAARAWRFLVGGVRRGLVSAHRSRHALDGLRRRYVFGGLSRREFEDAVKALGGRRVGKPKGP